MRVFIFILFIHQRECKPDGFFGLQIVFLPVAVFQIGQGHKLPAQETANSQRITTERLQRMEQLYGIFFELRGDCMKVDGCIEQWQQVDIPAYRDGEAVRVLFNGYAGPKAGGELINAVPGTIVDCTDLTADEAAEHGFLRAEIAAQAVSVHDGGTGPQNV